MLLCNYEIYLSTILKIGALRYIRLSKIKNLNFTSDGEDQHASPCQISSKSHSQRYGDLAVFFKMAAGFDSLAHIRTPTMTN